MFSILKEQTAGKPLKTISNESTVVLLQNNVNIAQKIKDIIRQVDRKKKITGDLAFWFANCFVLWWMSRKRREKPIRKKV